MKKRAKRFNDGGMASSGPQSAFYQPRNSSLPLPNSNQGIFQLPPDNGSGIGGVGQQPQPMQQEQPMQMKKGGRVKKFCRGGGIEVRGKTRGKFV
jgi:hypothetical protein